MANERIKARFNNQPPYSATELAAEPDLEIRARNLRDRVFADMTNRLLYGISVTVSPTDSIDFIEIEVIHRDCYIASNSRGTFASSSYSGAWRRALCNL